MDMIGHYHRRYDMPLESSYRLAKGGKRLVVVEHVSASFNAEGDEINDALIEPKKNRNARRMSHRATLTRIDSVGQALSLAGRDLIWWQARMLALQMASTLHPFNVIA
jgi:hypothetical protein